MANLIDIIAYVLIKCNNSEKLSKYRVTKMIYLADWCSMVIYKKRLTNIAWFFDNYGPFVWDIYDTIKNNKQLFKEEHDKTPSGADKILFKILDSSYVPNITEEQKQVIDYVILHTINLETSDFTKLIYSTYPIRTTNRYSFIDLEKKAKEFIYNQRKEKKQ